MVQSEELRIRTIYTYIHTGTDSPTPPGWSLYIGDGARRAGAGRGRSLHLNTSRLGYKTLTASATPLAAHRLPQHAQRVIV